jgi:hypothetical protein
MHESTQSIIDRTAKVLESISDISKPNFRQLARDHDIPYQRLLARSKGRSALSERQPSTYKLSYAQDNALYGYIARLDELGVCARLPMIDSCANCLQRGHDGPGLPPSANHQMGRKLAQTPPRPPY